MSDLISMFLLGIFGTGHCIGMCGPVVFVFPGQTGRLNPHLAYHAGRITTYVTIGILIGVLVQGLERLSQSMNPDPMQTTLILQVTIRFIAAIFMMIFGIHRLGLIREPAIISVVSPNRLPGYKFLIRSAGTHDNLVKMLLIGLLLGLLPCGLSYAAFARILDAGSPWSAGILVLAFGLGTLPGLLIIGTSASVLFRRYRKYMEVISGVIMVAMAIKLVVKAVTALSG